MTPRAQAGQGFVSQGGTLRSALGRRERRADEFMITAREGRAKGVAQSRRRPAHGDQWLKRNSLVLIKAQTMSSYAGRGLVRCLARWAVAICNSSSLGSREYIQR